MILTSKTDEITAKCMMAQLLGVDPDDVDPTDSRWLIRLVKYADDKHPTVEIDIKRNGCMIHDHEKGLVYAAFYKTSEDDKWGRWHYVFHAVLKWMKTLNEFSIDMETLDALITSKLNHEGNT